MQEGNVQSLGKRMILIWFLLFLVFILFYFLFRISAAIPVDGFVLKKSVVPSIVRFTAKKPATGLECFKNNY